MSSVLAIVSKALFEKMVPKDVKLGAVVDTNQYMSNNKTFDGLKDGGAIFLVTVRPPDEKLWLVGILENPKKKGETWTSEANEAPLTDITGAIKKLEFASGTGLKAKKGALGMSLQTPRALTDDDVKLLRGMVKSKPASGSGKVHANDAYMKAVDAVVHKHKNGGKLGKFRLENKRKPFAGKPGDLEAWEKTQIQAVLGKGVDMAKMFATGGKDEDGDEGSEMAAMEIADVVDTGSNAVVYQLMLWPYGDGAIVTHKTTKVVSYICQHGLDPVEDIGKAWTRDFAHAWLEGSKRLKLWTGHIDFDEEELGDDADDDE
jgi:hypothetical protein